MATNVGGVSVAVSLDVRGAVKQLEKLDKELQKVLGKSSGTNVGGVTNEIDQTNNSIAKTAVTAAVASKSMAALSKSTKTVGGEMSTLGQAAILSRRNPLAGLGKAAGSLTTSFKSLGGAGIALGASFTAIAVAAIAATAAVVGLIGITTKLGKLGLSSARELEVLNLSMEAITGSSAAAAQEIRTLQDIAVDSPFLTTSIINLDKFLLSQGVASGALREDLTRSVLDLSAALGLADENLGSITYALAQVQARGYLSGDEMRQLANQFIPVIDSLRALPEYSELSTSAIRKLIEQGQISSTTFFDALIASTEKYEGVSAKAALTLNGLINKLEDVTRISLGQAYIDVDNLQNAISPLGSLRDALGAIVVMLEKVDWRPFAAALGALTDALVRPFTDFASGATGDWIISFFNEWLPNAILVTAKGALYMGQIFIAFGRVFGAVGTALIDSFNIIISAIVALGITWGDVFKFLGIIAAIAVGAAVSAFGVLVSALGAVAGSARLTIGILVALYKVMMFDFAGAAAAWNSAITGAQGMVTSFGNAFAVTSKTVVAGVDAIDELMNAFRRIEKISIPAFPDLDGLAEGFVDVAKAGNEAAAAGDGGGGGGAAATIDELSKVLGMLWDLTRRWRGMRSELEKGFLGDDGFTATVDQILDMGKELDDAFVKLGRVDIADWIYQQTLQLIALAEKRNELTEELNQAEAGLAELVESRDAFADQLRESAINFAAALDAESNVVTKFEQMSDRGFFIESEEKEQKSLVETLEARAQALDEYFKNIKQLYDSGLDAQLLEDLLAAGPESSGETAAALAAGGQEMVDSVNILYSDIRQTADAIADYGTEKFHDSGVEQAEALVDGLTAELEGVEAAAEELVETIYAVVGPFAQEMQDVGAAGGDAMAGGITESIPAIESSMDGVGGALSGGLAGMDDILTQGGNMMDDTFSLLGTGWIEDMVDTSQDIIDTIDGMVESINGTLEGWKIDIDPFNLDFSWSDVSNAIADYFNAIRRAIYNQLDGTPIAAMALIPGLLALYYWARGAPASGSGGGTRTYPSGYSASGSYIAGAAFSAGVMSATQMSTPTTTAGGDGEYFGGSTDTYEPPIVKVYIGDTELRGIVRTEVVYNDSQEMTRVLTGRRA